MTIPLAYAAVAARRNPPALPFGWGAVTVLLVGVVAGTAGNTARDREAGRTSEVRVRCQSCGRLNPEFVKFCMSCGKPV